MTNLNFIDRTSYLNWVKVWKAEYAELSDTIRQTKNDMKAAARAGNVDEESFHASRKMRLRADANQMLEARKEAKLLAQQQYVAERNTQKAA